MTFPVHTTKHIGSSYKRLNIISAAFTVITLAAALLAALSGIQLYNLQKKQAVEMPQTPPVEAPEPIDDSLVKELEAIKSELTKEKEASKKLKANLSKLKKQKSALEKSIAATKTPKPDSPPPVKKTIVPPAPKEIPSPAPPSPVESDSKEPVEPKPGIQMVPEAPKDPAEPSAAPPSNAPSSEQPKTEAPQSPTENTTPPIRKPQTDQPVLESPETQNAPNLSPDPNTGTKGQPLAPVNPKEAGEIKPQVPSPIVTPSDTVEPPTSSLPAESELKLVSPEGKMIGLIHSTLVRTPKETLLISQVEVMQWSC
jgi:hypothetical protein